MPKPEIESIDADTHYGWTPVDPSQSYLLRENIGKMGELVMFAEAP